MIAFINLQYSWCFSFLLNSSIHVTRTKKLFRTKVGHQLRLVILVIIENTYIWDKKPTCEARISIPRWASENATGKRILCSVWAKNNSYVLGLLYGLSWCISDLFYFQVRLFPKNAWYAKWDMRTFLSFVYTELKFLDKFCMISFWLTMLLSKTKNINKIQKNYVFHAPKPPIVRQDSRGKTINHIMVLNILYLFKMLFQILICGIFSQKG